MTGESVGIDEIMDRVDGLALPLNKVGFNGGSELRVELSTFSELAFSARLTKTRVLSKTERECESTLVLKISVDLVNTQSPAVRLKGTASPACTYSRPLMVSVWQFVVRNV